MPNPNLVARIAAGGELYDNWTSVQVTRTYSSPTSDFAFSCAEVATGKNAKPIRLKPLDRAQIFLAGIQIINGFIEVRNAGYDANQHQVIVQGRSQTCDIVDSSADAAEYKGYKIDQIVRGLIKPHGVNLVTKNLPAEAQKAIKEFRVQYGETAWEAIERLGRMRGVFFTDDAKGNLVMSSVKGGGASVADFVEGENILQASAMLKSEGSFGRYQVSGQNRGTDQQNGAAVAQVSAQAVNPAVRENRKIIMVAEEPLDTKDAQARADREVAEAIAREVECVIVVQGWKRPDGQLWDVADHCTVQSPMLFPNADGKVDLAIRQVVFSQSAPGQTLTTLSLCLPNALNILPGNDATRGEAPNILSGNYQAAQPQAGSA